MIKGQLITGVQMEPATATLLLVLMDSNSKRHAKKKKSEGKIGARGPVGVYCLAVVHVAVEVNVHQSFI